MEEQNVFSTVQLLEQDLARKREQVNLSQTALNVIYTLDGQITELKKKIEELENGDSE